MANLKIKVLLIDDEAQFRATTEKILMRRGFETILAESGPAGLDKLAAKPDVVILDIKMPGMDGLDVLAAIRKAEPKLPVIMLTGHGSESLAQDALKKGAYDFLAKPCDIDLLASKITEAYRVGHVMPDSQESRVKNVMIPIAEYTSVSVDAKVRQAIELLRQSFHGKAATDSIMETGHRSVLVTDMSGEVAGILAISDLLQGLMPTYLSAPRPSTADSIQYSPMFWAGAFTRELKILAERQVSLLMSPVPPAVDENATLMEASYQMLQRNVRRLLVKSNGKTVGVIREQDLFFEVERILR
ncbi:histidine kinase [Desulfocarbo indianensis]|nr:histidine kinase [Desulfocarbo indianensis]